MPESLVPAPCRRSRYAGAAVFSATSSGVSSCAGAVSAAGASSGSATVASLACSASTPGACPRRPRRRRPRRRRPRGRSSAATRLGRGGARPGDRGRGPLPRPLDGCCGLGRLEQGQRGRRRRLGGADPPVGASTSAVSAAGASRASGVSGETGSSAGAAATFLVVRLAGAFLAAAFFAGVFLAAAFFAGAFLAAPRGRGASLSPAAASGAAAAASGAVPTWSVAAAGASASAGAAPSSPCSCAGCAAWPSYRRRRGGVAGRLTGRRGGSLRGSLRGLAASGVVAGSWSSAMCCSSPGRWAGVVGRRGPVWPGVAARSLPWRRPPPRCVGGACRAPAAVVGRDGRCHRPPSRVASWRRPAPTVPTPRGDRRERRRVGSPRSPGVLDQGPLSHTPARPEVLLARGEPTRGPPGAAQRASGSPTSAPVPSSGPCVEPGQQRAGRGRADRPRSAAR